MSASNSNEIADQNALLQAERAYKAGTAVDVAAAALFFGGMAWALVLLWRRLA